MNEKLLFVDDDPNILEGYQRKLQRILKVDTAKGGQEGLRCIAEKGPYAVVVADMRMPVMNGIEFLARVKERSPDTVRMMLTGDCDIRTAMNAVNEGSIFRFLAKPCPAEILGKALVEAVNHYRLTTAERTLLEETLNGAIELLVEILPWVDPEAFGQGLQLRAQARALAHVLKVEKIWEIEQAALLFRIGEIMLPRDLRGEGIHPASSRSQVELGNEARRELTQKEQDAVLRIPQVGHDLLARIPRLESVARIILYQDKLFNGAGFPVDNIVGSSIPIGARILKVLIDLIALEQQGIRRRDALAQMRDQKGRYDPRVLDAAIDLYVPAGTEIIADVSIEGEEKRLALQIGDVLVSGVRTLDDRLLVNGDQVLTETLLVRLRTYANLVGIKEPIRVKRPQPLGASALE